MNKSFAKEVNFDFIYEDQPVFKGEGSLGLISINKLSEIQEQVNFLMKLLAGLAYNLTQEYDFRDNNRLRILRNPNEITDYVYNHEANCVMLTSPEYMPVVLKCKDRGWLKDKDEFADWLMLNWEADILVIAIT